MVGDSCHDGYCGAPYHGYWAQNFYKIDERFGGASELHELSAALKERGMCLIMDIVANHVRPIHRQADLDEVYPFNGTGQHKTIQSSV